MFRHYVNKNVRGDHYVTLVVQTPTNLNEEAKKALEAFDAACGNRPAADSTAETSEKSEKTEKKKKKVSVRKSRKCLRNK